MIDHLRYDGTGSLVGEYMIAIAGQAASETVGLWEIVPAGRLAYGLSGVDLDEFIGRFICVLVAKGWRPIRTVGVRPGYWMWAEQTQYGAAPTEIAQAILAEWHANGSPDPEWDWVKFAREEVVGVVTPDFEAVEPRNSV